MTSRTVLDAIAALQAVALDPKVPDDIAAAALQTSRAFEKLTRRVPLVTRRRPARKKSTGAKILPADLDAVKKALHGMGGGEVLRDDLLKRLGWNRRDAGRMIVLGRAMVVLGYEGKRVGKQPHRRWVFSKG